MSDADIGYGSLYEISTDGGANWIEIGEMTSTTPPSVAVDAIEVTHMQSPGRRREYKPGLADPGEMAVEMNHVPGSDTDLLMDSIVGLFVKNRFTWRSGVWSTFDGFLTAHSPTVPLDDKMTSSATFKVSGEVVKHPAAAPVNVTKPAISGIAEVGEVLTSYAGKWTGAPQFAYQWKNEGVNIPGATQPTYTLLVGDQGDTITVTVTATNGAGSASATSAGLADIAA